GGLGRVDVRPHHGLVVDEPPLALDLVEGEGVLLDQGLRGPDADVLVRVVDPRIVGKDREVPERDQQPGQIAAQRVLARDRQGRGARDGGPGGGRRGPRPRLGTAPRATSRQASAPRAERPALYGRSEGRKRAVIRPWNGPGARTASSPRSSTTVPSPLTQP